MRAEKEAIWATSSGRLVVLRAIIEGEFTFGAELRSADANFLFTIFLSYSGM